jgi:hypothetical protein
MDGSPGQFLPEQELVYNFAIQTSGGMDAGS